VLPIAESKILNCIANNKQSFLVTRKKMFTPILLKAYNRKYKKERFGGDYYVARVASGVLE
jgi:hypothetical protein